MPWEPSKLVGRLVGSDGVVISFVVGRGPHLASCQRGPVLRAEPQKDSLCKMLYI